MAKIIDGKAVSASVKQQVSDQCAELLEKTGKKPAFYISD